MLVAQITDLHLGFDPDDPDEFNRQRVDRTLAVLAALDPVPDLLLVTGDIADNGDDADAYRRYKEAIRDLPFPVYPAMGNHDSREAFLAAFPETPTEGGFIQGLRSVVRERRRIDRQISVGEGWIRFAGPRGETISAEATVLNVTDGTDACSCFDAYFTYFTTWQLDCCIVAFFSSQLRFSTSCAYHLCTLTWRQFDRVNK